MQQQTHTAAIAVPHNCATTGGVTFGVTEEGRVTVQKLAEWAPLKSAGLRLRDVVTSVHGPRLATACYNAESVAEALHAVARDGAGEACLYVQRVVGAERRCVADELPCGSRRQLVAGQRAGSWLVVGHNPIDLRLDVLLSC